MKKFELRFKDLTPRTRKNLGKFIGNDKTIEPDSTICIIQISNKDEPSQQDRDLALKFETNAMSLSALNQNLDICQALLFAGAQRGMTVNEKIKIIDFMECTKAMKSDKLSLDAVSKDIPLLISKYMMEKKEEV